MSSPLEPVTDADSRAQQFAQRADLGWVAGVLVARRNEILERWLAVARAQPALDGAFGLARAGRARHIEEVREDFLATTLHDVEQPLTAIKGHAQLAIRRLSRMGPAVGPVFENLRSVESEANRMTRML